MHSAGATGDDQHTHHNLRPGHFEAPTQGLKGLGGFVDQTFRRWVREQLHAHCVSDESLEREVSG
jgi:hypothetical protein